MGDDECSHHNRFGVRLMKTSLVQHNTIEFMQRFTLYLFDESHKGDFPEQLHVLTQMFLLFHPLQDGHHIAAEMEGIKLHLQVLVQLL